MNAKQAAVEISRRVGRYVSGEAVSRISLKLGFPAGRTFRPGQIDAIEAYVETADDIELDPTPPEKLPTHAEIEAATRAIQARRRLVMAGITDSEEDDDE